jgi:hypothetical protein
MHEVFYEEASARQEAIIRALTRNSSAMSTREAKWKPLLHSVNVRFAAMGAPTINFDQPIQKISNTKKTAKKAWNPAIGFGVNRNWASPGKPRVKTKPGVNTP